ncbi:Proline iminopeptidase [[Actinomadura] parvosata subsp. kistnae]|uniref:Proline iminopeptidase n=1 Tax=[Actinomadura] parvosata subsp. kistnae TaxID=1909395 RepID=A0A1U9ZTD9_9ACTN|nr:alpha/beta fold hydrolase [Nonomuraea sp. ATCC 55076]AQZ61202.1 proline iminopeptidase [Nonomuraea sp. ATCC 55076]SPL97834.1 Proline iminopeptidase [Actinomadura parvosata subsp. kistnae]
MITATYTIPGMRVRDHVERVPLDWSDPEATITVFAREVVDPARDGEDLPCLLYLQGGPGGKGPRPVGTSGWLGRALETYRVILLDQRGTGRSSRIDGRVMSALGAREGADYLARFRADSIVADAEHLRRTVFGGRRWSTLGQSYGGFLTMTYLSNAPEGLSACYVAGGLPSLDPDAAEVYRRTYPRVAAKNAEFYRRYPHHAGTTARLVDRLAEGDVLLPDGDTLTVRRLQSLGIDFGMKPGYERMHWLLDESDSLPETFLHQVLARSSYADNPLFAALQESIYGHGAGATAWAAQRERARHPAFAEDARPLLFTGEMIYPWMFEEIRALRPFRGAVELLAERDDWPPLYDLDRLAANDVPVAAAVYFDDMYVDSGLQLETAARVGNTQAWVTNEYEHDGIGEDRVFARLTALVRDLGGGLTDG